MGNPTLNRAGGGVGVGKGERGDDKQRSKHKKSNKCADRDPLSLLPCWVTFPRKFVNDCSFDFTLL